MKWIEFGNKNKFKLRKVLNGKFEFKTLYSTLKHYFSGQIYAAVSILIVELQHSGIMSNKIMIFIN